MGSESSPRYVLRITGGRVEGRIRECVMRVRQSCDTGLQGYSWFAKTINKKVPVTQKSNNVSFAIIKHASFSGVSVFFGGE